MTMFVIVNLVFVAAFIALAVMSPPWWVWVAFVAVWIVADYFFAKDIHLAWWHWALLLAALTIIDVGVLRMTGQI